MNFIRVKLGVYMNTKLTLNLDKDVIQRAKQYAEDNKRSLSSIVESYFRFLTDQEKKELAPFSPIVNERSGVIELEEGFKLKDGYQDYLIEKYS